MKNKSNVVFKIETGIPIPATGLKYPFKDMKIGDSFFVPNKAISGARTSRCNFSKKHKEYKFITRNENDGIRVWRVSATI